MTRMQFRPSAGVVSAVLLVAAGGCATGPKAGDVGVNYDPSKIKADHAKADGNSAGIDAKLSGYDEMPTPPPDAQYTIYCQAYAGADHQAAARRARDVLRANTPLGKWYVVHGDQESTLYYGFYRTFTLDRRDPRDATEAQRALGDLNAIRTLHDDRGMRLFSASLPVSVNSPDPAANPAWDLTRSGGYWSLEVATFKDTPDRKARAVAAVADARDQGYHAFYYHGPHASSVCIGSWPRAAALEITAGMQNTNSDDSVVFTNTPLTESYKAGLGPGVKAVAPHVEPVDPSMIQALAAWPTHAVNGSTLMQADAAGRATDVPLERSFLFVIPSAAGDATAGDDTLPTVDTAAGPAGAPDTSAALFPPPPAAGTGQLRTLGDAH